MKSLTTKERFVELRVSGMSYSEIASELVVSKQTIINWSKELQVEIHNGRAIQRDSLLKRLQLSSDHRLEIFGVMLERLKAEFLVRDLTKISSEKILDQIAKLNQMIKDEMGSQFFWRQNPMHQALEQLFEEDKRDEKWPV